MFRYRLFTPMGDNAGEVELAIPTISPGEQLRTGDGRLLHVLEVAPIMDEDSPFQALLTVEPLE